MKLCVHSAIFWANAAIDNNKCHECSYCQHGPCTISSYTFSYF